MVGWGLTAEPAAEAPAAEAPAAEAETPTEPGASLARRALWRRDLPCLLAAWLARTVQTTAGPSTRGLEEMGKTRP